MKDLAPRLHNEPERLVGIIRCHANEAQAVTIRHALPYIPASFAGSLLELAESNNTPFYKALCLGSQLMMHPEDRRPAIARAAFDLLQEYGSRDRRMALGFIAPYQDGARMEMLAEEIDSATRVQLFQDALWSTSGELRTEWLQLAREALTQNELYGLANYLPDDERSRVLITQAPVSFTDCTLQAIVPFVAKAGHYEDVYKLIFRISDTGARVRAASSIMEHLRDAEPARVALLCNAHLKEFDSVGRRALYDIVVAMAPVLFRLGGYDAIRELETTITRGLSWWTDVASAQLGALK
jgi:hypothetical protein